MPVIRPSDGIPYEVHGSRFRSVVRPDAGSTALCAWRLEVPANLAGAPHRPDREEIIHVLDGQLHITLDGERETANVGDTVLVPAGGELTVDAGPDGAVAWVTTTAGLQAELADGTRISPPWAN